MLCEGRQVSPKQMVAGEGREAFGNRSGDVVGQQNWMLNPNQGVHGSVDLLDCWQPHLPRKLAQGPASGYPTISWHMCTLGPNRLDNRSRCETACLSVSLSAPFCPSVKPKAELCKMLSLWGDARCSVCGVWFLYPGGRHPSFHDLVAEESPGYVPRDISRMSRLPVGLGTCGAAASQKPHLHVRLRTCCLAISHACASNALHLRRHRRTGKSIAMWLRNPTTRNVCARERSME